MTKMPDSQKLTAKQNGFAQSIADGANQSDAYRLNYACENMSSKQIWEESSKLAANPKVSQRIASLKQAVTDIVVAKTAWDQERLIEAAEVNLHLARQDNQWSAANGALRLIGKAAGLLNGHPQVQVPITKVTIVLDRKRNRESLEDPNVVDGEGGVIPETEDTPALAASYRVLSPDPNGFDRDRDRIGCER